MRKLLGMAAVLAAVLMLSGTASAQGKKGKGFGRFGFGLDKLTLLTGPDVQKELKLTDDQVTKVKELSEKAAADRKEAFSGGDKQAGFAKFKEIREASDKAVGELLKEGQAKRLAQLQVQQQGAGALLFGKVSEKLDLSQDQKEKIQEVFKESGPKFKEIFPLFKEDKEAAQKKMAELQKSLLEDALKVLNDDQKKTYEEMRGAPFTGKFPQPNFFGMGMGMGGASIQLEARRAPRLPTITTRT
jgi:hypothetical protein